MDLTEYFDAPLAETTSPSIVLVALSKWVKLMRAMNAVEDSRHREVLTVMLRIVHLWAEELQDHPSYDEMGQQLVDCVVDAIEFQHTNSVEEDEE